MRVFGGLILEVDHKYARWLTATVTSTSLIMIMSYAYVYRRTNSHGTIDESINECARVQEVLCVNNYAKL